MVRPPSTRRGSKFVKDSGPLSESPDSDRLEKLKQRLDEAQRRQESGGKRPPPTPMGIAGRLATELVGALVVGGGLGWGIDWLFGWFGHHTRPVFLLVFLVLGIAAGIRNVFYAARQLNADAAGDVEEK
jgi:ATP synthase protein I